MATTRAHLTNLLKKAQKTNWYNINRQPVPFSFVYMNPKYVDWAFTGDEARELYDEINLTMCKAYDEAPHYATFNEIFTSRQREILGY